MRVMATIAPTASRRKRMLQNLGEKEVLFDSLPLLFGYSGKEERKGIAEKKVSKYLDDISDESELVPFLEQFQKEEEDSGDGVDGEREQLKKNLAMVFGCFDQTVRGEGHS